MAYRAAYPEEYCNLHFGPSTEWADRASYRAAPSRRLFWCMLQTTLAGLTRQSSTPSIGVQSRYMLQLGLTAFLGPRWKFYQALATRAKDRLKLSFWRFHDEKHYQAYSDYFESIVRAGRLEYIAKNLSKAAPTPPESYRYDLANVEEEQLNGFYFLEIWQDEQFRWAKAVASIQISLPVGNYEVVMKTLPIRPAKPQLHLNLFFNGHRINRFSCTADQREISFRLDPTMFKSGLNHQNLVLICQPLALRKNGSGDTRELGLPVSTLEFSPLSVD